MTFGVLQLFKVPIDNLNWHSGDRKWKIGPKFSQNRTQLNFDPIITTWLLEMPVLLSLSLFDAQNHRTAASKALLP